MESEVYREPVQKYRVRLMWRIVVTEEIEASSEAEAIDLVREMTDGSRMLNSAECIDWNADKIDG